MYHEPYYLINENNAQAYIRILHAAPKAPAVDIYANDNLIAENLKYRNFTEYISVMAGRYNIKVYPAGKKTAPVIDTSVNIISNTISTIAAIGEFPKLSLLPVEEPRIPIRPNRAYIRVAHLSPNAPNVNISQENGILLFENIAYKEVTDYLSLRPETYTFEVKSLGSDKTILYVPNARLTRDRFYTLYIIGLLRDTPPLQMLIPLDGNSYLRF
ncbi:uncharacterized protein DUF4397 [Orenia metallireducens]|uniref:DUF4397 domain-containing protein n=1 Tax=Orenia metallireducens TaxID=1413210 RepID=A0A285H4W0_9FIRM|nr:DUF4397 domain-containing protein [Orenia metallireducens]PRX28607.1 uncharacterized protein DUF4397 [Orenia metallireducens]SNY30748.1 protein of unknown function [Orenia metallireducens]